MKHAVIVLPTYNEAENVKTLIPAIFNQQKKVSGWQLSILVVDDNSPDNTAGIVKHLRKKYQQLHLITGKKQGLGKAYQRGFLFAIDKFKADLLFEIDADWSHDPNQIPKFIELIDKGADIVIGSRYMPGGSIPSDWGLHRKLFSKLGNIVIRFGFMNFKLREWTNGYRAIKADFIKQTLTKYKNLEGYIFQIGILDQAIKNNLNIVEIPCRFVDRKSGKSKINSIQYITSIFIYIFQNSSFIKFSIVGLIGAVIDFGLSYLFIEKIILAIWLATIISAESAIISNFILNNFWSFKDKKINHRLSSYIRAFIKFNTVSIGSIIIQAGLMQTSVSFFPKQYWYFYKIIIIILIIIPYSYVLYNKFIWKKK